MTSLFQQGVQVKRAIVAGLLGGLLAGSAVEAAVYRWVDESGKVVYSQTPPPENLKGEKIRVNAPPPATPVQAEKDAADEGVKGNPALDPELRKEYCDKGRKVLEVLKSATPDMEFLTEDGKSVKYTREELDAKKKEAQMAVRAYCD
ncbi:DUF4124 domain-containing protein [Thiolapillus sp.]